MNDLKTILYNELKESGYLTRDILRSIARVVITKRNANGFDSASADRALRKLTEAGLVKRHKNKKFIKGYSIINLEQQTLIWTKN